MGAAKIVIAVVVTRNRNAALARCLRALENQQRAPDQIIVVDYHTHPPKAHAAMNFKRANVLCMSHNADPASAFGTGIRVAIDAGADYVWLMYDDGMPADGECLRYLLATANDQDSALTCPLVCDIENPADLAFPIRQQGRPRFTVAALAPGSLIENVAYLFRGSLIASHVFTTIGLPDARLFIRGDEVEFLLRARRKEMRIVTVRQAKFLRPSSAPEIFPILAGKFIARVPADRVMRHVQFRNHGWVFARYHMWGHLAADHLRYALYFLGTARDLPGYWRWFTSTWSGVAGRFGQSRPASPAGIGLATGFAAPGVTP